MVARKWCVARNYASRITWAYLRNSQNVSPPDSTPDIDSTQAGNIEILGLEECDKDEVFKILSSETARTLLVAINDEPGTPSELADRLELSIQTVSYHLESLHEADLIRVTDTRYSEKGREMKIYAPSDNPVVLVVGTDDRTSSIRALLTRFLGAVGALAILSLLVQYLVEGFPFTGLTAAGNQPEPVGWSTGVAFFVGGFVVLVVAFCWQAAR